MSSTASVIVPSTVPALPVKGVRPSGPELSRAERSDRTAELLAAAHARPDQERIPLLDEVVVLNCRIADAVAARFRDRGVPLEDLQQAAYEGLVKAVRRFDPAQNKDLLTYAVPTIRGEVQRYFRDRSWMVRPPRRVQELQTRSATVVGAMLHELGREPSQREICDALGVDESEYAEVVAGYGCFRPPSLDQPVGEGRSATLGELVADERDARPAAEARCMLGPAVGALARRDQRVVYLRFVETRTQREIGDELGITQMQVSRLLDRILRDLRRQLEGTSAPARVSVSA